MKLGLLFISPSWAYPPLSWTQLVRRIPRKNRQVLSEDGEESGRWQYGDMAHKE